MVEHIIEQTAQKVKENHKSVLSGYDESRSGYGSPENLQQADGNVSSDYLSGTGSASA